MNVPLMPPYFAGIDPSLTSTAVVVLDAEGYIAMRRAYSSKPNGAHPYERLDRYVGLCSAIVESLFEFAPLTIALEGYSFHSRNGRAHQAGEFGGLLRYYLRYNLEGCPLYEVPPAVLKRFATGRGNAGKAQVVAAVVKRWGIEVRSDDEADALALAHIARCLRGDPDGYTVTMRAALASLGAPAEVAA